ncbi:MAG: hypothetical protein PHW04_00730 [Candidatus Wallbacteria bacterium]|nr:hypothetical protein [Candidatus Wallbacteria bacterium]
MKSWKCKCGIVNPDFKATCSKCGQHRSENFVAGTLPGNQGKTNTNNKQNTIDQPVKKKSNKYYYGMLITIITIWTSLHPGLINLFLALIIILAIFADIN